MVINSLEILAATIIYGLAVCVVVFFACILSAMARRLFQRKR